MSSRLTENNLNKYLVENYGGPMLREKKVIIEGIQPLLQKNYGEAYDCTLTSITTIISWLDPTLDIQTIYDKVESIAKKYLYNGSKTGTMPIFIQPIFNQSLEYFNINKTTKFRYFKKIFFDFEFIQKQIDNNNPLILSLLTDGRDYYKNHSITIIGYSRIQTENRNLAKMLLVYDNWSKEISYIDYNKLSIISGINF